MTSAARSIAATTLLLALCPALGAASTPSAPTPLAPVASVAPQIQMPAAEPQKLVLQTATALGAPAAARGDGKVAMGNPATFLFQPEAAGLFSIGVSSPQNAARISVYVGDSTQPEAGTSQADGAIRWSTTLDAGAKVKIVVHTAGAEIPFRVEAIGGPGSV